MTSIPQDTDANRPNQLKEKFKLRCSLFSDCFVASFGEKLDGYRTIDSSAKTRDLFKQIANGSGWAVGSALFTALAGLWTGTIVAIAISVAGTASGSGGSFILNQLLDRSYSKKAKTVIKFVDEGTSQQMEYFDADTQRRLLQRDLVEAALRIFELFEYQFMMIIQDDIPQVASDAAKRAMNYIVNNKFKDQTSLVDALIKGVLLSNKPRRGHKVTTDSGSTWYTSKLFRCTAVKATNCVYVKKSLKKSMGVRPPVDLSDFEPFETDAQLQLWLWKNGYKKHDWICTMEEVYRRAASDELLTEIRRAVIRSIEERDPKHKQRFDNIENGLRDLKNMISSPDATVAVPTKISFKPIPEPQVAFTGRVEFIASAIQNLCERVSDVGQIKFACLVIHALGGYGKTETARKIASICRKDGKFQHFIWIDSENDTNIKNCFVGVMKLLGLPPLEETTKSSNFDSLLHQFYDRLVHQVNEKFLIIFDNVQDFDQILNYLPLNYPASNIGVLMTSQRPFTKPSYGSVMNRRLDVMAEEEAMQLVENILDKSMTDSEEDKKLLVERSERIALVLCIMASSIKYQRKYKSCLYGINDYLQEMGSRPIEDDDQSKDLDLNYDKNLQTIVRFAVNNLNEVGGVIGKFAVRVFDRLAYCSTTNKLTSDFVENYLRDIYEEVDTGDLKLMKPVDNLQVVRMAIDKLSEFSLAQYSEDEFSVHSWVQASRRLHFRKSGDDKSNLKKLLSVVPDMTVDHRNTTIIWQHVADYAELIGEFYAKERTLCKFPVRNIDVLEKIGRALALSGHFEKFTTFFEEMEIIILYWISVGSVDELNRLVSTFDYDVREESDIFISKAIDTEKLSVVEWLINEKSCIPEAHHLRNCVLRQDISWRIPNSLKQLKPLSINLLEIFEKNPEENLLKCLFNCALNKLESIAPQWTSRCVDKEQIQSVLYDLKNVWPFEIFFGNNFINLVLIDSKILSGESPLECLFNYDCDAVKTAYRTFFIEICEIIEIMLSDLEKLTEWKPLNTDSGRRTERDSGKNPLVRQFHSKLGEMPTTRRCIRYFEIIRTILCAMKKLQPTTELSDVIEKYSERNLLECLFVCGGVHEHLEHNFKNYMIHIDSWDSRNALHEAACENDLTAIDAICSTDPTLIESRTDHGMTSLMYAVQADACEATAVLLEQYSADTNAVDNDGWTPLSYAIENYRSAIVKILLRHGAKTYWQTESGEVVHALHAAVKSYTDIDSSEPQEMAEALLQSGDCNVSAIDRNGDNILHLLIRCYYTIKYKPNHCLLQSILQANDTLVNIRNNDGLTPLQLANTFLVKFTDDHWHAESLRSLISELTQVCDRKSVP